MPLTLFIYQCYELGLNWSLYGVSKAIVAIPGLPLDLWIKWTFIGIDAKTRINQLNHVDWDKIEAGIED